MTCYAGSNSIQAETIAGLGRIRLEHTPRRILIADDHAVVRKGIIEILKAAPHIQVDGEVESGTELLKLLRSGEWDAVIMDLRMPGVSGLDLMKRVRRLKPDTPVLILTVEPEDIYARRLLQAGASGYLTKDTVATELITAVEKVCNGGRFVSEAFAEQLVFTMDAASDKPLHERLSDREFEVLRLLSSGMTPTAIADKLCLSVKTVSTHRKRILEKMGMRTNADLMKYAIQNGLVE